MLALTDKRSRWFPVDLPDLAALLTDMIPLIYIKLLITAIGKEFLISFTNNTPKLRCKLSWIASLAMPSVYTLQGQERVFNMNNTPGLHTMTQLNFFLTAINHLRNLIWYLRHARLFTLRAQMKLKLNIEHRQIWNLLCLSLSMFFLSFAGDSLRAADTSWVTVLNVRSRWIFHCNSKTNYVSKGEYAWS